MVIASGMWSTTSVSALLGSFTTYLFQGRTAERAQSFERDERLRYEQVNACSAFASAMTELKRRLITMWFYQRRDAAGADYLAARIECDRLGASAEAARFLVQLVSGDPEVMTLADAAFTCGCTGRAAVSPGPGVLFSGLDDAGSSGRAAHDDAWPEQAASGTGKGGTGEAAEIAALI
jgi:hypothetical protein